MDWFTVALFLALFAVAIIVEITWLTRNGWTTSGRAAAYVLLTDILGIGVGLFTIFVAVSVMIMMAFGSSGGGGTAPDFAYWVIILFGLVFPPIFLLSLKRLFLLILRIRRGRSAWLYSILSTGFLTVGVYAPPIAMYWLMVRKGL